MPFEKGNVWTKLKKGMKYQPTLDKERRRAIFDAEVEKDLINTIRKAKPEYKLDQYIGKAKETIDHKVNFLFEDATDSVEKLVE